MRIIAHAVPVGLIISVLSVSVSLAAGLKGDPMTTIIPRPVHCEIRDGEFRLTEKTEVLLAPAVREVENVADLMLSYINRSTGYSLSTKPLPPGESHENAIVIRLTEDTSVRNPEGYLLEITPRGVLLSAREPRGLFYAVQTVLQLLPPEVFAAERGSRNDWTLPALTIRDYPRFIYRGMHLDVSRHFFPAWFIKRYIDLIALHKMNVFHWHLTDDNGWRIEIKRYPKLVDVSAWRVDREDEPWRGREPQEAGEKATYGGYYTQDEIREIVAYAAARHVTVIPEIEMPGHSSEVLAAYPELSCTGGQFTVATGGYWPNIDIFCGGNDSVFVFIENVLSEVMGLFPGKYIHIGGDEADKRRWRECAKCQARISNEGLQDEEELQSYFIRHVEKFLIAHNRRLIGWDEILEGGLAPEATVMSWRGVDGGIEAAKMGHDVVMTPTSHCYFDYYQADPEFEPEAIGGFTTLKRVYSLEPVPSELTDREASHVLGAQGNVWTEFIPTPSHAEYMSVPRMSALAEVVWTPSEDRQWEDFRQRLDLHFKRLAALAVNYSKGSYAVEIRTIPGPDQKSLQVILSSEQSDPTIRYTLDGTEPTTESQEYTHPVALKATSTVRAGVFLDGELEEWAAGKTVVLHKAVGRRVEYKNAYTDRIVSDDSFLVDGLQG
ncbi:MAG: family 20 glycosylhydrolase, partial [Bacteroidetes bacterium]|nr:family 20 glycosylhydrolase [Bacteroidota bacterium]